MRNRAGGFSVVELQFALGIIAAVAGGLAGALRAGVESWRKSERAWDEQQNARALLSLLSAELRNAVPFPAESLIGTSDNIQFFTARPRGEGDALRHGVFHVAYGVANPSAAALRRIETTLGDAPADDVPRAAELPFAAHFSFPYAAPGRGGPPLWKDRWAFPGVLPAALRVRLTAQGDAGKVYERVIFLPAGELPPWRD